MNPILRFFTFLFPITTLFLEMIFWSSFHKNRLETITCHAFVFYLGYTAKKYLLLAPSPLNRFKVARKSGVLLTCLLFFTMLGILTLTAEFSPLLITSITLLIFIQGTLFEFDLDDTVVLFFSSLSLPFLIVLLLSLFFSKPSQMNSKEITLSKGNSFEEHFRFTEEAIPGALPIHRLYRNNIEKFNSLTEQARYLCMVSLPLHLDRLIRGSGNKNILILEGADGVAARSALFFLSVKKIMIVDPNKALFDRAREDPKFRIYNLDSLQHKKTTFIQDDPIHYLVRNSPYEKFDVAIADLTPSHFESSKWLLTFEFLSLLSRRLSETGMIVLMVSEHSLETLAKQSASMGYSALAVRPKKTEKSILILSRSTKSLEEPILALLQGPQSYPCERLSISPDLAQKQ